MLLEGSLALDITTANDTCLRSEQCLLERSLHAFRPVSVPIASVPSALPPGPTFHERNSPFDCLYAIRELPSIKTAISAIKFCAREKQPDYAAQVYLQLCSFGLNVCKPLRNELVPMFVECGELVAAKQVFEAIGYLDSYSWTSLICGLINRGCTEDAFQLYQSMNENNIHVDNFTLVVLLQACAEQKLITRGRELHTDIFIKGLDEDIFVCNTLLGMYAKCCPLMEARLVFDTLPKRDVVSWTILIQGYAEHESCEEALTCFEEMEGEGISPNAVTFSCILKACCSAETLDTGRGIHIKIMLKGYQNYPSVSNSLISMYSKFGLLSEARKILSDLPSRGCVSWTSLIAGYAEHGPAQEAINCFDEMLKEGVSPDAVTFACSLKACGNLRAIEKGRYIHKLLLRKGFGKNIVVGNALIGMYAKCGALKEAEDVFDQLSLQDCVSWTTLISGYAEYGCSDRAIHFFEQMCMQGVAPNTVTLSCALKACADMEDLAKGRSIHSQSTCSGLDGDLLISSSLIGMYASCGALSEAQKVFDKAADKDVVSYTALITGYCKHGFSQEALKYFDYMHQQGLFPDPMAFACSLKACSDIGALDRGREIHLALAERGLQKVGCVGNALIDMYSKCGSLSEAKEVFDALESRDIVSWTSLISGYVEHGLSCEALRCYEKMQEENVNVDAIIYSCILNACGSIGAIQKGREIHRLIAEEEFEKDQSVCNSLISMYARCGNLTDARDVLDTMPVRDLSSWSSMMKGYCLRHDGIMALCCFEDMQKEGINPDSQTFTCLLTACSHSSLLSKGLHFYKLMKEQYDVIPTLEHHTCVIDLLARSGRLYEAEKMVAMLCPSEEAPWEALLAACKTFNERELGLRCFQQLIALNSEDSSSFTLMADTYVNVGNPVDGQYLEFLRRHGGVKKKPATAVIEVNDEIYEFVKGGTPNKDISAVLEELQTCAKQEGHLPNVDNVLKLVSDNEKEGLLCEHAEKLAIAFGLLNTPEGSTIRVTKNLRMCSECHTSSKIISKVVNREIILRDTCCIHHFKDGICSCGDMF
ncbi:hypothetical protein KP509_35G018800 [Ceratopteris richardii]|uniref:DYW domain-containing protein n=1 Tax=Ceratopteris richardii TaxID=49495 RepID=A0A8T2QEY1_CERRI|nr:hypothetical protein KP509_35G018800 [Ceratopteris richardii]